MNIFELQVCLQSIFYREVKIRGSTFTPSKGLIKSPTLPRLNLFTNPPQTPSNDDPNSSNMNKQSNNVPHNQYTIPIQNSFEQLSNVDIKKNTVPNVQKPQAKQKDMKIPPITVVGATNFAMTMKILNDSAPNIKFSIKYIMSIGTKILVNNIEDYRKLKSSLNAANVEFFSQFREIRQIYSIRNS